MSVLVLFNARLEVLPVGTDDAYLRHVLRVHHRDIVKFQPDFSLDEPAPGGRAFLVQRNDETVGVVVLADEGQEARVVLDYVTPRLRDFSPGEFVWRQGGLLRDSGATRVVTHPDMVDSYYARVGFRREGRRFVLDL